MKTEFSSSHNFALFLIQNMFHKLSLHVQIFVSLTKDFPRIFCNQMFLLFCSQAETRAEFAERSVAKLEKTIDDLEGRELSLKFISMCII